MKNIIIGTAQLGLQYGAKSGCDLMSAEESHLVMDFAFDLGIRTFDTAMKYGEAHNRILSWAKSRALTDEIKIITKINWPTAEHDLKEVAALFSGFDTKILIHESVSPQQWSSTQSLANYYLPPEHTLTGISCYTRNEILRTKNTDIEAVQAPANILDPAAYETCNQIGKLLLGRSVFLQGVFLEAPERAEKRCKNAGKLVQAIREIGSNFKHELAPLILAATRVKYENTPLILGFDNVEQMAALEASEEVSLGTCLQFLEEIKNRISFNSAKSDGTVILDPRTWRS